MTTLVKAFHKMQDALISIGVPKKKADEVTEAFTDVIESNLATKDDIQKVGVEIKYLRWFVILAVAGIFIDIVTNWIVS